MPQRQNLKPALADTLRALRNDVQSGATVPHGVKTVQPGEGLQLVPPEGGAEIFWDWETAHEYDTRITEGRVAIEQARADLDKAEADLATGSARLDENRAILDALGPRVDAAQSTAAQAAKDLTAVDTRLSATSKDLTTLQGTVGDVSAVAETARQQSADANQKALDAAGLAGTKGRVIYSSAAPTSADANTANLWIRSSDNKPHTWTGAVWTARTDKTAADAAAAAGTAKAAADKAQSDATKALADAATAKAAADSAAQAVVDARAKVDATASDLSKVDARLTAAAKDLTTLQGTVGDVSARATASDQKATDALNKVGAAQVSADGKTTITRALEPRTTQPGSAVGDTHFTMSSMGGGGVVTRQQRWDGKTWQDESLSHQVIASLDLGKATVGELDGGRIRAGTVTSDRLLVGIGDNLAPDPNFQVPAAWTTPAWIDPKAAGYRITGALVLPASTSQRGAYMTTRGALPASRRARFSVWVKSSTPLASNDIRVFARAYKQDGTWVFMTPNFVGNTDPIPAGTWARVAGEFAGPEDGATFTVGMFAQPTATGTVTFSEFQMNGLTEGALIVNGTITAEKVEAVGVAAKLGQFIKVQAQNVEVTEALSARVVNAMSAGTKNLVVTDDAILNRATVIEGLITPKITVVSDAARAAQAAADAAATKATTAKSTADTANSKAGTALSASSAAQGAADTATTKLNALTTIQDGVTVIDGGTILTGSVKAKQVDALSVAGELGQFIKVQAQNVEVTEALSARVVNSMDSQTRRLVVTEEAVLQHTTLLGTTVADQINVRRLIRGRDAILDGTVDINQLNVTGPMAAEIVRMMDAETRRLVVTEDAILNRATVVEGLVTSELISKKANIEDLAARMVTSGRLQTDTAANRGVKLDNAGIRAWDGAGQQTVQINGRNNYITGTFATAQDKQRVEIKSGNNTASVDLYGSNNTIDHMGIWHNADSGVDTVSKIISFNQLAQHANSPGVLMYPFRGEVALAGRWARESDTLKMFYIQNNNGMEAGMWADATYTYATPFTTTASLRFPFLSVETSTGRECIAMVIEQTEKSIKLRVVNKSSGPTGQFIVRGIVFNANSQIYGRYW